MLVLMVPSALRGMLSSVCNDTEQRVGSDVSRGGKESRNFLSNSLVDEWHARSYHVTATAFKHSHSRHTDPPINRRVKHTLRHTGGTHSAAVGPNNNNNWVWYRSSGVRADGVHPPERRLPGESADFLPVRNDRRRSNIFTIYKLKRLKTLHLPAV